MLPQMDGLARSNALVFVLAATNLPWELDMAMLRRLEKRIFVTLPDPGARLRILSSLLEGRCGPQVVLEQVAASTEGYSGSDVFLVAKEAAMRPLRRLMSRLEATSSSGGKEEPPQQAGGAGGRRAAAAPPPEVGKIEQQDIQEALLITKASARQYEKKYAQFSEDFGQPGS